MKPSLKVVVLAIVLLVPLFVYPGEKVVIDLKVPLVETADLAPAQAGATVYLMKSDWAVVSEINEDLAVWLKGYDRKKNLLGQQVISLTLEVREPSSIRTGNLIKKREIKVRYCMRPLDKTRFQQEILKELEQFSQELQIEAYQVGTEIESVLRDMLK